MVDSKFFEEQQFSEKLTSTGSPRPPWKLSRKNSNGEITGTCWKQFEISIWIAKCLSCRCLSFRTSVYIYTLNYQKTGLIYVCVRLTKPTESVIILSKICIIMLALGRITQSKKMKDKMRKKRWLHTQVYAGITRRACYS